MAVDIQKYTIAKLISEQNTDFLGCLPPSWFTGLCLKAYNAIFKHYSEFGKLPNLNELTIRPEFEDLNIIDNWVSEYRDVYLNDSLLFGELENNAARNSVLDFMIDTIPRVKSLSAEELNESLIQVQSKLCNIDPSTNEIITDGIEADYEEKACTFVTSGFSSYYDKETGGFAYSELIVLGGERGSGKSIISQNLANYHYLTHKNTTANFNIEMSAANVRKRFLSQISGVPYNDFRRMVLTEKQKQTVAAKKAKFFYQASNDLNFLINELVVEQNIKLQEFNDALKDLKRKEEKYFFIDDASLTMAKLDYTLAMLVDKYGLRFANIDYINIIKDDASSKEQDWLLQQKKAERLKELAKKHDIIILTPYQIHTDGSAKRAKAIEDSVDRSFKFFPKISKETGLSEGLIKVYQSKARDNASFPFLVQMHWDNLTMGDPPDGAEFEDKERSGLRAA